MKTFRFLPALLCCFILVGCEAPQDLVPWVRVPDDAFHKLVDSLDKRVRSLRQESDKKSTIVALIAYQAPVKMDDQFIWREGRGARNWDRRLVASSYNFNSTSTVGISDYGVPVQIEYGSPKDKKAKLHTVGLPCLIRDLGPVDFNAVQLPQDMSTASVAVEPAKGNTYVVHIQTDEDHWAKMTVIDMVKDEWIIFRWQRLNAIPVPTRASKT